MAQNSLNSNSPVTSDTSENRTLITLENVTENDRYHYIAIPKDKRYASPRNNLRTTDEKEHQNLPNEIQIVEEEGIKFVTTECGPGYIRIHVSVPNPMKENQRITLSKLVYPPMKINADDMPKILLESEESNDDALPESVNVNKHEPDFQQTKDPGKKYRRKGSSPFIVTQPNFSPIAAPCPVYQIEAALSDEDEDMCGIVQELKTKRGQTMKNYYAGVPSKIACYWKHSRQGSLSSPRTQRSINSPRRQGSISSPRRQGSTSLNDNPKQREAPEKERQYQHKVHKEKLSCEITKHSAEVRHFTQEKLCTKNLTSKRCCSAPATMFIPRKLFRYPSAKTNVPIPDKPIKVDARKSSFVRNRGTQTDVPTKTVSTTTDEEVAPINNKKYIQPRKTWFSPFSESGPAVPKVVSKETKETMKTKGRAADERERRMKSPKPIGRSQIPENMKKSYFFNRFGRFPDPPPIASVSPNIPTSDIMKKNLKRREQDCTDKPAFQSSESSICSLKDLTSVPIQANSGDSNVRYYANTKSKPMPKSPIQRPRSSASASTKLASELQKRRGYVISQYKR